MFIRSLLGPTYYVFHHFIWILFGLFLGSAKESIEFPLKTLHLYMQCSAKRVRILFRKPHKYKSPKKKRKEQHTRKLSRNFSEVRVDAWRRRDNKAPFTQMATKSFVCVDRKNKTRKLKIHNSKFTSCQNHGALQMQMIRFQNQPKVRGSVHKILIYQICEGYYCARNSIPGVISYFCV